MGSAGELKGFVDETPYAAMKEQRRITGRNLRAAVDGVE